MEDRKLYHLINGEFVHDGMPSVHIPSYAEIGAHIAILNNVGFFDDPIAESVPAWDGLSNGKRTTEKQASLYDAMMAEIHAEKSARAEKFRKTHDMRKKSKDDTPADRRKNRINRMHRLYGTVFEDGKDWYWKNGKEGQKNSTEPDAEIFRNRKYDVRERSLRDDWNTELSALTEEISYAEFMLDSDLDDLAWLKNEIFEIGNPDGVIALYEERIKELRKESERKAKLEQYKVDTEKRVRNGEEYMRKYNYVKEMM